MSESNISPLAKRLAEENNVNWRILAGSGPEGRVVERDVLEYLHRVMVGDEALDPTPEPLPAGLDHWPDQDPGFGAGPSAARSSTAVADGKATLEDDLLAMDLDAPHDVIVAGAVGYEPDARSEVDADLDDELVAIDAGAFEEDGDDEIVEVEVSEDLFLFDDAEGDAEARPAGFGSEGSEDDALFATDPRSVQHEADDVYDAQDAALGDPTAHGSRFDAMREGAGEPAPFDPPSEDAGAEFTFGGAETTSLEHHAEPAGVPEAGRYDPQEFSFAEERSADADVAAIASDDRAAAAVSANSREDEFDLEPDAGFDVDAAAEDQTTGDTPDAFVFADADEAGRQPAPEIAESLQEAEPAGIEFGSEGLPAADSADGEPEPEGAASLESEGYVTDDPEPGDAAREPVTHEVAGDEDSASADEAAPQSVVGTGFEDIVAPAAAGLAAGTATGGPVPHTMGRTTLTDLPVVSHGVLLRRHIDLSALTGAQHAVGRELDDGEPVPFAPFLARAAAKALRGATLNEGEGVAVAILTDDGVRVRALPHALTGAFTSLVASCTAPHGDEADAERPSVVIADLSDLEIDEAVLHLDAPVLTLGRILFDSKEGVYRSTLSLSGDISPERGARFLARVVQLLDSPVGLLI